MKTILDMDFIQCGDTILFKINEQDDMLRSENNETKLIIADYGIICGKTAKIGIYSDNCPALDFIINENMLPTIELYLRGKKRDLDNSTATIRFPSEELASIFYINIENLFRKFADLHDFNTYAKINDYRWYKTMHICIEDRNE